MRVNKQTNTERLPMTDAVLENPIDLINNLQTQIQALEHQLAIARQSLTESRADFSDYLKWLRTYGVIPLYLGHEDFEVAREKILHREPNLVSVLDQVWLLTHASVDETVKSELIRAFNSGHEIWR